MGRRRRKIEKDLLVDLGTIKTIEIPCGEQQVLSLIAPQQSFEINIIAPINNTMMQ